jgi:hypothetical protein
VCDRDIDSAIYIDAADDAAAAAAADAYHTYTYMYSYIYFNLPTY